MKTKKQWKIEEARRGKLSQPIIVDEDDNRVCSLPALSNLGGKVDPDARKTVENATLIVIAPELLELAVEAANHGYTATDAGRLRAIAQSILAKLSISRASLQPT